MPYIIATPTWSAGVTLTADEDWCNRSPRPVLLTREAPTAGDDGGILVRTGQVYPLSAGDTVYCRAQYGETAHIWREQI